MNTGRALIRALAARLSRQDIFGRLPDNFGTENRRLVLQSLIVGAAVWGPAFLLKLVVHETFDLVLSLLAELPVYFIIIPLVVGAVTVAYIATRARTATLSYYDQRGRVHELIDMEGDGLERAIALYYASEPSFERALLGKEGVEARWELPTVSLAFRKFAATWATLGSGGSGGLEASVALMGESVAAAMFKPRQPLQRIGRQLSWLRRPLSWWTTSEVNHLQTAQLSGIAAGVARLAGVPFMSAFFAAEVMCRRRPLIEKLIYSLIATLVAYFLSTVVHIGHRGLFQVETLYLPPEDWRYYGTVLLMSLLIALLSLYFIRVRQTVDRLFHQRIGNLWSRQIAGALVTATVAIGVVMVTNGVMNREEALHLVLSTGDLTIERAMAGQLTLFIALVALTGKIITTTATIGSGGSAGLLIPALYLGTMVASMFGAVLPFEPMTLIVPAMTASLVSIVNVPMAAMLLPVELFSAHYLPPALLAVVVCAILTEDRSLYRTQRETFDDREIVPGVAVRRMMVPVNWDRRTLIELDLRRRFNVTVIGLLELGEGTGRARVRMDPSATSVLNIGDTVVVLGSEEDLDRLERHIHQRVTQVEEEIGA